MPLLIYYQSNSTKKKLNKIDCDRASSEYAIISDIFIDNPCLFYSLTGLYTKSVFCFKLEFDPRILIFSFVLSALKLEWIKRYRIIQFKSL